MKITVVGGSAAGPKTAAKARRMDQHAEITIGQEATGWTNVKVMEGGIMAWPLEREK